ncbi:hypothetical protein ACJX0J_040565, partial [Zea mays]
SDWTAFTGTKDACANCCNWQSYRIFTNSYQAYANYYLAQILQIQKRVIEEGEKVYLLDFLVWLYFKG